MDFFQLEARIRELEMASHEVAVPDVQEVSKPEPTLDPINIAPAPLPVTSASGFQSPPVIATSYFRWDDAGSGDDPFSMGQAASQAQDFSFHNPQHEAAR